MFFNLKKIFISGPQLGEIFFQNEPVGTLAIFLFEHLQFNVKYDFSSIFPVLLFLLLHELGYLHYFFLPVTTMLL